MHAYAALRPQLGRLPLVALVVGVLGLALLGLAGLLSLPLLFQAYLYGYLFWFNLALGSLALLMLQYLTGGRWGLLVRRTLEAGAMTLPLMALLFAPLLFGLPLLYPWARIEALADEAYLTRAIYLNVPGFIARAALFFAIWIALAAALSRLARAQDHSGNPALPRRMRLLSAAGVVLYVITITLASTDWAMSLDYHWYSSIYGMYFMASEGLITLGFLILALALLRRQPPLGSVIRRELFHDLGSLLFAFTIIWTYMSFAQYLIIWAGNLSEEAPWYLRRSKGGWTFVAIALGLFHFAVPFFLLLSRRVKRSARLLGAVAAGLLLMRALDLFWLLGPEFYPTVLAFSWAHLAALAGVGGLWLAAWGWLLARRPFLPHGDPALAMVLGEAPAGQAAPVPLSPRSQP